MKEGWEYKTLGEISGIVNNIKWKSDVKSYLYIDLTSVDRETSSISNTTEINRLNAPSRAKQIVKNGDILFATTRPTLRRVAIINQEYDNNICSTGFCVIRPISNLVISKLVFYILKSDHFYKYIEPLQTGANYPAVTNSVVKLYNCYIPKDTSKQQQIVSYLDTTFANIEKLKSNASKALSEAKAIFQAALTEAMMPKDGWEEKTLKEISVIYGNYGLSVPSIPYNGVRYLRITDITEFGELNNEKVSADVEETNQNKLEEGDILFARTGATVGKTLIYKKEYGDCLFAGYLIRYRINKEILSPDFLFYITHSKKYYDWIAENQKAAAQPNISAKLYNNYIVCYPNLEKQHEIVRHLDSLSSMVRQMEANYRKTLAECDALKQAILRDVFE